MDLCSVGQNGVYPTILANDLFYSAVNAIPARRVCPAALRRNEKMVAKPARKSVAIIVPPNAQSLDVSGPLDAFLEANRQSSGGALYDVRLVAAGASRTIKAGGMS